jgi:hypothetical protein
MHRLRYMAVNSYICYISSLYCQHTCPTASIVQGACFVLFGLLCYSFRFNHHTTPQRYSPRAFIQTSRWSKITVCQGDLTPTVLLDHPTMTSRLSYVDQKSNILPACRFDFEGLLLFLGTAKRTNVWRSQARVVVFV